jgi:hypothetical protein
MTICHIGHGKMKIPPNRWGAVEALIWDYKFHLEKMGHDFRIVNSPNNEQIIEQVNRIGADVIHLHDERRIHLIGNLNADVKIVTTHSPI